MKFETMNTSEMTRLGLRVAFTLQFLKKILKSRQRPQRKKIEENIAFLSI